MDLETLEEVVARISEVKTEITGIDAQFGDHEFTAEARDKWNTLNAELEGLEARAKEKEARINRVKELAQNPKNVERVVDSFDRGPHGKESVDIYDVARTRAESASDEVFAQRLRDNALRSLEKTTLPAGVSRTAVQDRISRWLDAPLMEDESLISGFASTVARHILTTGSPIYRRAFWKGMFGAPLSGSEQGAIQRALSLSSGVGVLVPYQLDPSIIPSSNFSVNPWRAICRQETIAGTNEWRGVSAGLITATYQAEGTEAADASPTLTSTGGITAVRCVAFVPFSRELGQDVGNLEAALMPLLTDGKDDLEATKFFSGSGTNEPYGLNTLGVAADQATAVASTFAIGDLYTLESALPPRYRPRARIVGNRAILNKIRQFDTSGGAGLWMFLPAGLANNPNAQSNDQGNTQMAVLGYPTYESTQMLSAVTTGNRILAIGDFRYYIIIDRIGMSVDIIPHLFGAANRFPTGQSGFYAFWRNTGKPLVTDTGVKFLKVA